MKITRREKFLQFNKKPSSALLSRRLFCRALLLIAVPVIADRTGNTAG